MLGMSLAGYTQAQKKDGTFASESGMEMQVDSMVYKNESRPVYYARYGNRGCAYCGNYRCNLFSCVVYCNFDCRNHHIKGGTGIV